MKQMPISKLNDRLNGDTTLRRYERSNAGVRLPGRNDIRVERQKLSQIDTKVMSRKIIEPK